MAKIWEPTKEQLAKREEWLRGLPEPARRVMEKFNSWTLYWLKDKEGRRNWRVVVMGCDDDGKLIVAVSGDYNLVAFERQVFGLDESEFDGEADLPGPGDPVGIYMTDEQRDAFLAAQPPCHEPLCSCHLHSNKRARA